MPPEGRHKKERRTLVMLAVMMCGNRLFETQYSSLDSDNRVIITTLSSECLFLELVA